MLFAIYLRWVIHKALLPFADGLEPSNPKFNDRLFDLYMLGDRLGDKKFKNEIVDQVEYGQDDENGRVPLPCHESICKVYEHTTRGCTLQKRIIEIWARLARPHDFTVANVAALPEFYAEVLKSSAAGRRRHEPVDHCYYHEHGEDNPDCIWKL